MGGDSLPSPPGSSSPGALTSSLAGFAAGFAVHGVGH